MTGFRSTFIRIDDFLKPLFVCKLMNMLANLRIWSTSSENSLFVCKFVEHVGKFTTLVISGGFHVYFHSSRQVLQISHFVCKFVEHVMFHPPIWVSLVVGHRREYSEIYKSARRVLKIHFLFANLLNMLKMLRIWWLVNGFMRTFTHADKFWKFHVLFANITCRV